jgi:toxin ParE1/3/4
LPEYTLSRDAEADLDEIATFTEEHWGREQAERYILELRSTCNQLAGRPGIGRICTSIRRGLHRFEFGSHVIFYRRTRTGILISRFLHKRMLPSPERMML